jgi:pyruvate kinase
MTCMHRILVQAETHQAEDGPRHLPPPRGGLSDHVAHMTVELAQQVEAAAIIAPTITGRTARLVARHRPRADIVAVTSAAVARQLGLVWGVHAVTCPFPIHAGDDRLEAAVRAAFLGGAVRAGALVVVLAGHPVEGGEGFPTIRLVRVGEQGSSCEA